MKTKIRGLKKLSYATVALATFMAAAMPALQQSVFADQVTSRAIEMSDSSDGATGVTYHVSFTTATAGVLKGIVVDFCDSTPIVGDSSCANPGSFSVAGTASNITNLPGTWTPGSANTGRTFTLVNATNSTSVSASTTVSFDITGVTNPSTTDTTFYARILTYLNATGSNSPATYAPGSEGTFVDYGGIALSTATVITITAKVQEQISFCVYTQSSCGNGSAITLGDTHGVLSDQIAYVNADTKYDISTNAQTGAVVRFKGSTLTSGSHTITAIGASAAGSSHGTAQFGLCSYIASGTGVSVSAPYNDGSCSGTSTGADTDGGANFALDTNTTDGSGSTYGDQLASSSGAVAKNTGHVAYIANIPTNQTAGIYTTNMSFIATGTY